MNVALRAAGGVRGTVDPDGRPISGVEVDFEGPDQYGNQGEFYAVTDAKGEYSGVDLPPAGYWVCFTDVTFWEKCDEAVGARRAVP